MSRGDNKFLAFGDWQVARFSRGVQPFPSPSPPLWRPFRGIFTKTRNTRLQNTCLRASEFLVPQQLKTTSRGCFHACFTGYFRRVFKSNLKNRNNFPDPPFFLAFFDFLAFFVLRFFGLPRKQKIAVNKFWVHESEIGEECRQFWT